MINPLKCPKCRAVPLALLQKDYTLKIICDCGYKGQCSLSDLFNNKLINSQQETFQCEYKKHSEKGIKFCLKCQVWLCQSCIKEHNECNKEHQLINTDLKLNCRCTYHKHREMKYFCNKCHIKICELCKKGLYVTQGIIYDNKNNEECFHNFVNLSSLISEQQHLNICSLYLEVDSQKDNSNENETNNYLIKLLKLFLSLYDIANRTNNYYIILNLLDNFDIFAMNNVNHRTIRKFIKTNHSFIKSQFTLSQVKIELPEFKMELFCIRLLKDGRLAMAMNEGIIKIYSLPSFKEDAEIKESKDSMYFLFELDSGILLCGSDFAIFCYEPHGKDYKRIKVINIAQSITQIISLDNELFAAISNTQLSLFIFNKEYPFDLAYVEDFRVKDGYKSQELNIVYKIKENLVLLGYKDKNHIDFYNYKTKTTEKIIDEIGTFSYDCIREFLNFLIIGGQKQISVVDKNKFEVVAVCNNILCDVYFIVNFGINKLLIGGDDYFYSFDVLNYTLTKLVNHEIKNKAYAELENNRIIVFEKSELLLKLYNYSTEEID